jgi:uncharacterized protein
VDQTKAKTGAAIQAAAERPITARRMRTRNLAMTQRHWLRGDAYATAFFNALSAVFPHGEAFMIESLRPWQARVPGKLADDVRAFIEQEAAHSREHAGMNRALISAGYDMVPLDRAIRGFVGLFANSGEITKLGATMCIEHITAVVGAELLSNSAHLEGADPELHKLWLWHSVEEVEHKAVAFDVWMFATRSWSPFRRWITRSALMVAVTASFFVNRTRGQVELLRQDGMGWRTALPNLLRHGFAKDAIGRQVLRPWAKFLTPGFHPWQIDDHALIAQGETMIAALAPPSSEPPVEVEQPRPAVARKAA